MAIDFDFMLPPELEDSDDWNTYSWLTADKIGNGKYEDFLRVSIAEQEVQKGKNCNYLTVLMVSLLDDYRWKLQQNYFGGPTGASDLLISLMKATGITRLSAETASTLVGKRLEIKVAVRKKNGRQFVNIIDHREIVELKSVANQK